MIALTIWRAIVCLVCAFSFVRLLWRFWKYGKNWNGKTRDYWYSLTMWSLAGMSLTAESIIRQAPFRYSIVFVTAAAAASLIGLRRKGGWGSDK